MSRTHKKICATFFCKNKNGGWLSDLVNGNAYSLNTCACTAARLQLRRNCKGGDDRLAAIRHQVGMTMTRTATGILGYLCPTAVKLGCTAPMTEHAQPSTKINHLGVLALKLYCFPSPLFFSSPPTRPLLFLTGVLNNLSNNHLPPAPPTLPSYIPSHPIVFSRSTCTPSIIEPQRKKKKKRRKHEQLMIIFYI